MLVKSEKVKVADKRIISYVKNNEDKTMHILEIGDIATGITEELIIDKNNVDLLKDINKGDTITICLKNRNGRFQIHNIIKEK